MVVSPNPNPYSPTMRCEGSGSPSDRPASIAGQLVGVCVTCRQVVPVLAAGPYATCEHSRGDVLALFYDECT